MLTAVKAVFVKDLKIEFRNKQMINNYFILSLLILVAFRFGFLSFDFDVQSIASPILWVTFFFSGMFSLAPIYSRENLSGTKNAVLLAPVSAATVFFGKLCATMVVIFLLEFFILLLFFAFFPVAVPDLVALLTLVLLGSFGVIVLGNVISAISSNVSQSEVMIPVLLVPLLLFTVVLSSVSGTSLVFDGGGLGDIVNEIRLLLVFDVVFLAAGYLLIDYVLKPS